MRSTRTRRTASTQPAHALRACGGAHKFHPRRIRVDAIFWFRDIYVEEGARGERERVRWRASAARNSARGLLRVRVSGGVRCRS